MQDISTLSFRETIMKAKAYLNNNTLKIKSSHVLYWILSFTGLCMCILGIFTAFNMHIHGHIVFSGGLIMTSIGLLFFANSRYYKIYFNRSSGFIDILESSFTSISSCKVPIARYSIISVQTNIYLNSNHRVIASYEVILMNNFGSSLYIAEFDDKGEAITFAKHLQDITGRDFYIDNTPVTKNVTHRDMANTRLHISLPGKTKLKEIDDGHDKTLQWKIYFSFFHYLFMAVFMYGLFHACAFYTAPLLNIDINIPALSLTFACLYITVIAGMLTVNLRTYVITITPTELHAYWQFMGKWIRFKKIKKENILMIKNSLNINKDRIEVISKHAFTSKNDIALSYSRERNVDPTLKETIRKAKNLTIRINTEPLSMTEKFYLEELIMNP